ncbi:hypothetical protein B0H19DRAFT_1167327 [Mycena capillaripes]|nr:hypothetical protein B0H19DRAFT_1167327 [Mycena capillaripes]
MQPPRRACFSSSPRWPQAPVPARHAPNRLAGTRAGADGGSLSMGVRAEEARGRGIAPSGSISECFSRGVSDVRRASSTATAIPRGPPYARRPLHLHPATPTQAQ